MFEDEQIKDAQFKEKLIESNNTKIIKNYDADKYKDLSREKVTKMFVSIIKSSSGFVISSLCFFLIQTFNLIFLGHSGTDSEKSMNEICICQIGNVFINIFGYVFCMGALHAFDTLGSHAYSRKDYELLYDIYHSARIFTILIFLIFMMPICFSSKYIFFFLNFEENFANLCADYIRIMLFSFFLNLFHLINGKLLQLIGLNFLVTGIYVFVLLIHIILNLFLTLGFNFGLTGIAYSSTISSLIALIITTYFVYIYFPFKNTNKEILGIDTTPMNSSKFYIYARAGIVSGFLHLMTEVRFDLVIFVSYYLDKISLTTNVILGNYSNLIFHILLGICYPIIHLMRKYIGKNKFNKIFFLMKSVFIICGLIIIGINVFHFFFKYWVAYMYISNVQVIEKFEYILNIYSIMLFVNWGNNILNSAIKAIDKHTVVNVLSFIFFIMIFLPVGIFVTFGFMGYSALWFALFAHMIFFSIIEISYIAWLLDEKKKKKIVKEVLNLIEDEDIFFK